MSARIDSSSDVLSRTTSLPSADNFTVAGWARIMVASLPDYHPLVSLHNGGYRDIAFFDNDMEVSRTDDIFDAFAASPGQATGWFYFAVTCNGTNLLGYWITSDGATTRSASVSAGSNFTPSYLGIGNDNTGFWINCRFSRIRAWSAVLSQSEVEAEQFSPTPVRTSNLHAHWTLVSNGTDSSGNGRNLTVAGGVTWHNDGAPVYPDGDHPVVRAYAEYQTDSTITSHSVNLPAGIESGDLLLMVFRAGSTQTASTPSGWNLLESRSNNGVTYIFTREATGSEGSTVTVTTGGNIRAAAIVYRISGWSAAEAAFASTNTNNPPSLDPSWDAEDTLYIAALTNRRSDSSVTDSPANYIGLQSISQASSTNTSRSRVSAAFRYHDGDSDDPAAFSTSGTIDNPHSVTIAVRGEAELALELALDAGAYTLTGFDIDLVVTRTLALDAGAYTLAGQDAVAAAARILPMDLGEYTLTGRDTEMRTARVLPMDAGAYTFVGQAAALRRRYTLGLDAGAYTLTGMDAAVAAARILAMDAGAYTLAGQDINALAARILALDTGAYTLTGIDPNLFALRALALDAGAYTYTGLNASAVVSRVLTLDAGAYTLAGQDAGLIASRDLPFDVGMYTFTGLDAAIVSGPAYVLEMGAGAYTITGQAAALVGLRVLPMGAGAYTITGQAAALVGLRVLPFDSGAYALAGQDAGLLAVRTLALETGAYTLAGQDVGLLAARVLPMGAGEYELSGKDTALAATRVLMLSAGAYTVSGKNAQLLRRYTLEMAAGEYAFPGIDPALLASRILAMEAGAYELTGQDAGLSIARLMELALGQYVLTGNSASFTTLAFALYAAALYANPMPDAGLGSNINPGASVGANPAPTVEVKSG